MGIIILLSIFIIAVVMTVKEIKEGMTAPEVAQTIKDNFDALNTEKETVGNVGKVKESVDNANKNTGVSNYPAFSATEDVAVGVVRNYNGLLYRSIVAGANEWNEANWERVSLESLQNEKLTELAREVIYDVSANNDGATFASLSVLLSSENLSTLIPIAVRCGGMNIRFVQSSDNKYVQCRLMNQTFSYDEADWQNFDDFAKTEGNISDSDLALEDENGNAIVKFSGGHIKTKNFNSENFTNVDNTSDADKPISTATQAALGTKANVSNTPISEESILQADLLFSDEEGNIIGGWKNGHVYSKYGSPYAKEKKKEGLSLSDEEGNVIAEFESYFDGNKILKRISDLEERPIPEPAPTPSIMDLYVPNYILGIEKGTAYGTSYFVNLYPESMVKVNTNIKLKLNNGKKYMNQNHTHFSYDIQSYNRVYTVPTTVKANADGYASQDIQFDVIYANRTNAKGQNIRLLLIGDSKVESWGGPTESHVINSGGYPTWIARFAKEDSVELTPYNAEFDLKLLGTRFKHTVTWDFKSNTYTEICFSEGRGGWTTWSYLNFPMAVYEDNARTDWFTGMESIYYLLGLATMTPFDSNVDGREYTAYIANDENISRIVSTPLGRYKPNYNSIVWETFKNFTNFTGTGDYNGDASDAIMEQFLTEIMENPFAITNPETANEGIWNPYYDIDKARAYTGEHIWTYDCAFNIEKWIERCRTCDDNGNQLYFDANQRITGTAGENNVAYLADGTLAKDSDNNQIYLGSNVSNTTAWRVCKPTHIAICLGGNDGYVAGNYQRISGMYDRIFNAAANYDVNIPVAYHTARPAGVIEPSDWYDEGVMNRFFDLELKYRNRWFRDKAQRDLHPTFSINNQINYLPIYFTTNPFSGGADVREVYDFDDTSGGIKLIAGSDPVHTSVYGWRSVAYGVLSWVYWTYQNNNNVN